MSKFTKTMGTACVLAMAAAAWTGSPAAAAPIGGPEASAVTGYTRLTQGDGANIWFLGGTIGGPLGFEGLGVQADAEMSEVWADHFSAINWTGGGDAFWGGDVGRVGIDAHGAHFHENGNNHNDSNIGVFGEYYFGNVTVAGKGGWLKPGGSNGNYLGIAGTVYAMPDLAISASFGWFDTVTRDLSFSPYRFDDRDDIVSIWFEYMFNEDIPLTVGGFFSYDAFRVSSGVQGVPGASDHATMFGLRLKYYTGGGSLMDHHRSGLLMDWDKGTDWLDGIPQ